MAFVDLKKDAFVEIDNLEGEKLGFIVSGDKSPVLRLNIAPTYAISCNMRRLLTCDAGFEFTGRHPGHDDFLRFVNPAANGAANIYLATNGSGQIGAFDLSKYGGQLIIQHSNLLAVTSGLSISPYSRFDDGGNAGYASAQLTMASGKGWLFCAGIGEVSHFQLQPGQCITCPPPSIAAMTTTIDMERRYVDNAPTGLSLVNLTGPGIVWLQNGNPAERSLPCSSHSEPAQQLSQDRPALKPGSGLASVLANR